MKYGFLTFLGLIAFVGCLGVNPTAVLAMGGPATSVCIKVPAACGPAAPRTGDFSVGIAPVRSTLSKQAASSSQTFAASVSATGSYVGQTPSRVAWSLADGTIGTLTPSASNPSQATFTLNRTAPSQEYAKLIQADVTVLGTTRRGTASVTASDGVISQVTGDVFAGGAVANLKIDPSSVVSATGTITNVGTTNTIANYSRRAEAETTTAINKLVAEQAVTLKPPSGGPYVVSGDFNLNPKSGSNPKDLAENAAKPEGSVWYIPGDLSIQTSKFSGRGTIVVDGSVTISGDLAYGSDRALLGVMARGRSSTPGDITIAPGVSSLVGAYYAPTGTITIASDATAPSLTAVGLFVGKQIGLSRAAVTITYDGRITKSPPPGFSQQFLPKVNELTP